MNMKKSVMLCLVAGAVWMASAADVAFRRPAIVPEPVELTYEADQPVRFDKHVKLVVTCPDPSAAAWVSRMFDEWYGFVPRVEIVKEAAAGAKGADGYVLSARPDRIVLSGNTLRGVKYALYTLRQAAERESAGRTLKGYWLPALDVKDTPALDFRGVHLCWFPENSATFIEHQIRLAAYYKFNYVVLESWGVFKSERHPYLAIKDAPLTVKEARRLSALAADLGVTLIPQFNIFGHAAGSRSMGGKHIALDFHPQYQPLFEPAGGWNWCLSNPDATAVVREYVDEMHEAFGRPPFFHVGCDEADEPSCPTCRAVYPYAKLVEAHIIAVRDQLKARGARIMMWHDMLLERGDKRWRPFYANGSKDGAKMAETLPRDIVICDWYYGNNYGGTSEPKSYSTLDYFKGLGYSTLTCPWDDPKGIVAQGRYAREAGLFGLLETVWHHFRGNQFATMMETAADAAWGGAPDGARRTNPSVGSRPFAVHWRQIGWDMGISDYAETGFYDTTVTRDVLDR